MGLFFFNIQIHANGHMYGSIQMADSSNKARRFNYVLDLACEKRYLHYEGKVSGIEKYIVKNNRV